MQQLQKRRSKVGRKDVCAGLCTVPLDEQIAVRRRLARLQILES